MKINQRSLGNMRFGYLVYGERVQESSSTGTRSSVRCLPVALSVLFPLPPVVLSAAAASLSSSSYPVVIGSQNPKPHVFQKTVTKDRRGGNIIVSLEPNRLVKDKTRPVLYVY